MSGTERTQGTELDAGRDAELGDLTEQVLAAAMRAGAADAEVVAYAGDEFNVHVRLGEVEQLTESGSRGMGLRVFCAAEGGQRTASTTTSDLSPAGLARLVESAVGLARVTGVDPFAGLPEPEAMGGHDAAAQGADRHRTDLP